jgi:serine protease Do
MQDRVFGFTALLFVVAVSIVFGMVVGGRLNTPRLVHAAPAAPEIHLAARNTGAPALGFADIAQNALPAVVGVTSQRRPDEPGEIPEGHPFFEGPFRQWFFGPEEDDPREPQIPSVGEGSGFVISADGYILTNNHVVDRFVKVQVRMNDGKRYDATVIGADPSIDLALLKVDPGRDRLPTLPLGDSDSLRVGDWVIAIGNPLQFEQTVTVGVVSGKERRLASLPTDPGVASFIQTDAAINFGNSGGPLLDAQGNVVGINTAIRRANFSEGIGFALPINTARAAMEQLRQTGEVRRGYIGIRMNQNEMDEEAAEYYGLPDRFGVIVNEVTAGGPADEGGLRVGDIIRQVDGETIDNNLDLIGKIAAHRPGDRVRVSAFRPEPDGKGEAFETVLTLGDRQQGLTREGVEGEPEPGEAPTVEPPAPPRTSSAFGITVESPAERTLERLGFEPDREGVLITDVEFGSDALEKGLRPTMLIVAINDQPTPDIGDWEEVVKALAPGRPVKIDVAVMGQEGEQRLYFYLRK